MKTYRIKLDELKKLINEQQIKKSDAKILVEILQSLLVETINWEYVEWPKGFIYQDNPDGGGNPLFSEIYEKYISAAIKNIVNEYMDRSKSNSKGGKMESGVKRW
jgi:hypothetical protein